MLRRSASFILIGLALTLALESSPAVATPILSRSGSSLVLQNPHSGQETTKTKAPRIAGTQRNLHPRRVTAPRTDWRAARKTEVPTWFGRRAKHGTDVPAVVPVSGGGKYHATQTPQVQGAPAPELAPKAQVRSSVATDDPVVVGGGTRGGINPNAVGCSSSYSLDFEQFANADYTKLDLLGPIHGFTFTGNSTMWRSIRYYNHPAYTTQLTGGAWMDFAGTSGTITFAKGPVSSFSLLASIGTSSYLDAYDSSGNLLATAGPSGSNVYSGTETEFRIVASAPVIDHVVWHQDWSNSGIIDMFCANGSYFGALPLAQTFGNGTCNCDSPKQFQTGRPVNTATGALTEQFTDISVPAPGVNFEMSRSYTSADTTSGAMGPGWTFGYNASLAFVGSDIVVRSEDGQQLYFTAPASGTNYTPPLGTTTRLSGSSSTGWTFTKTDQSTLSFNSAGKLTGTYDRLGQGLTFSYSGGNLVTATDAAGRVFSFTYSGGLLTQVALADGRTVVYGYTSGRLTSVTNMRGKTSTLAYDSAGRLASILDPNGHYLFQTVYDSTGRVIQQTDPRGKLTSFAWDPGTQTSTRTDPRGKVWTEVYSSNVLLQQTDPLGNTTSYEYDDQLNKTAIIDARGKKTTMTYDAAGNMLTRKGPAPSSVSETWTYTPFNAVATYTNGRGKTTTNEYYANQLPKKVTDPLGRATSYTWTSSGLLDTVTDPRGKVTDFGYNAAGNRTSMLSPEGNLTTFGYDGYGRRTSMVEPRGNVSGADPNQYKTTWQFNAEDQVTKVTDALGRDTTNTYDDTGNLIKVTDADLKDTKFEYDEDNQVTKVTDPRGSETTTSYDNNGNVSSVSTPAGSTTYTYDNVNRVATEVMPRGSTPGETPSVFTRTYTYDGNGNLLTKSNPTAGTTTIAYDELNRPVSITDAHGKVTTKAYNADGKLTSSTDPLNHTTTYTYDDADQPISMTDPLSKVTQYGYDLTGNLTSTTTPLGNVQKWTYDGDGRQVTSVDPRGNVTGGTPSQYTTTNTYDPAGHLLTVTDPLSHVTIYSYDRVGNLTSRKDPRNNSTTYSYDVMNRLKTVTDPLSKTTTYAYDAGSNVTSRTDANSHVTTYTYDQAGRMTQKTTPIGTWKNEYDAAGNLTKTETAAGVATPTAGDGTVVKTYDALDRLTSIDYSDTTPDVTFGYDELHPTSMTDNAVSGAASETYTYDDAGQLTGIARGTSAFTYTYDNDGRLTSRVVPDGRTITQTWDDDSRPTGVTSGSVTTSYTYDAAGNRTGTTFGNGVSETRTYDEAGRLANLSTKKGTTTISTHTFTRDANGNPTSIGRTYPGGQGETYTYDENNRVASICWSGNCIPGTTPESRYTYDAVGNKVAEFRRQGGFIGTITSTYNDADQLTHTHKPPYALNQAVDVDFTYDANGNQITAGSKTFTYDLENRLKTSTTGATTTTYTYDGEGTRLKAVTGTSTTNFTWDKNYPLPELMAEAMPTGTRTYLDDPDGDPIAIVNPGTGTGSGIQYLHPNGNGSISALTDSAGVRDNSYSYEPFGSNRPSPTNQDSVANPIQFASEYLDSNSNRYHLRARDYDPTTGRFNSLDPRAQDITDPYVSEYIYANDQPATRIDPSGMRDCSRYDVWCQVGLPNPFEKGPSAAKDGLNTIWELDKKIGQYLPDPMMPSQTMGDELQGLEDTARGIVNSVTGCADHQSLQCGLLFIYTFTALLSRGRSAEIEGEASTFCERLFGLFRSSGPITTANAVDIGGARFAQKSFTEMFSSGGRFAGKSIDDVASLLRSGALSPKDVPIDVIVRDGNTLILNTRSAQALIRAGIPRSSWNVIDRTGQAAYEARLTGQLNRNGLTSSGTELP
ncbi:MAG: RHS repeat-associated core domain-containing protein [Nocardioidaceae bacterium]|nr:RHS repeat-associated core domain-containing protein [Nocardioidaceae bacterium]